MRRTAGYISLAREHDGLNPGPDDGWCVHAWKLSPVLARPAGSDGGFSISCARAVSDSATWTFSFARSAPWRLSARRC